MQEKGSCGFCGRVSVLCESHILPAFAYRWLRGHSGTGYIRESEKPNLRVQDGLKQKWLCQTCEAHFGRYETAFSTKLFYPSHDGHEIVRYEDWLLKFCTSVSWRVLKFARGYNQLHSYTAEQEDLMDRAEVRWREFLEDRVPHPAAFEQHLLIFEGVKSSSISDLPNNINRFMAGAITLDIVGSSRSLMTFAKMGKFMIFGIIQKGPNQWVGTKVHVKEGIVKPDKFVIPAGLIDLFKQKASHVQTSMSKISAVQRAKIDEHILQNFDLFKESEQFKAILADAELFGDQAVIWDKKQ